MRRYKPLFHEFRFVDHMVHVCLCLVGIEYCLTSVAALHAPGVCAVHVYCYVSLTPALVLVLVLVLVLLILLVLVVLAVLVLVLVLKCLLRLGSSLLRVPHRRSMCAILAMCAMVSFVS